MAERRKLVLGLLTIIAGEPTFKQAVSDLRDLLADPASGREYTRPVASRGLSDLFGQRAADLLGADTSIIEATVKDISEHIARAIASTHPREDADSKLPSDVQAAASWLLHHHTAPTPAPNPAPSPFQPKPSPRPLDTNLQALRRSRLDRVKEIHRSLAPLESIITKVTPPHVKKMLAYAPHATLIYAIGTAIEWPDVNLAADMVCGMAPTGNLEDTGVFKRDDKAECASSFAALCEDDPSWNENLIRSITADAQKPENAACIQATWEKTVKECGIGWCTRVGGGLKELEARYGPGKCRVMRRFGVEQAGGVRACDNGAKSGHNRCTGCPERIFTEGADFPLEAGALFSRKLGIDGTWSILTSTCDAVAAYRRLACLDPSLTVVAQWDPRPAEAGGQRVAFFYVHGFNFGLKSAVIGYYRWSEFLTRAAVRLGPVCCCHFFDDWCIAEPTFCGDEGQRFVLALARLLGVHLDAVPFLNRNTGNQDVLPAKRQSPAYKRVFLGVETDFSRFATTGRVYVSIPKPKVDKIVAMIDEAIKSSELHATTARKLCGKLQFSLGWCVGRYGRAALQPLFRRAERRGVRIGLAIEMALNFFHNALASLHAREVCVSATGAGPPILIWSDAMYRVSHVGASPEGDKLPYDGQLGFVVRFPGGARAPVDNPLLPPPGHPRFVHAALGCGPEIIQELEVRRQQIGQLELLGAVAPYYSLAPFLKGKRIMHWIDNTAALAGIAKGYSSKPDSARIIHAFHALGVKLDVDTHFEYVASEANVADLPSRGEFEFLEHNLGSTLVPLTIPPLDTWLSPEQAVAHTASAPSVPPKRGGKRARASS